MDFRKLRQWLWVRQGLAYGGPNVTATESHIRHGWARSVGGANPYIQSFVRSGTTRERFDELVAGCELHELPSARGCTYTVSRDDYGLALKVGQGFADAVAMATAKKYMGVTDAEIDRLQESVVAALAKGPLEPKELKDVLGGAFRNLGDEGRKRGTTTTLPLAIGYLRTHGVVRNIAVNGRVDSQRYAYALWDKNPLGSWSLTKEESFAELAKRYFQWIGPATISDFAWFSGLGKGAAKAAIDASGVVALEPGSEWMIHEADRDAFHATPGLEESDVVFVAALDNLSHLRRNLPELVDSEHTGLTVPTDKASATVGSLQELWSNPIYDRGTLIGIWEYDPDSSEIAAYHWAGDPNLVKTAQDRMESFCRDQLGDARSFSLDSPKSREPRLAFIRNANR